MKFSSSRRELTQGNSRCVSATGFRSCFRILLLASALLFISCAPHAELTGYEAAVGKSLEAPKGKALICVYRPWKPFTGLIRRPVFVNKQHIASTKLGSFMAVPVDPGAYAVQAGALALFDSPEYRRTYTDIKLKLAAGQVVFIRQTVESSTSNSGSEIMLMQTGGTPIPIAIGGGLPPFGAVVEDGNTGRSECSRLKQVAADPIAPLVPR